MVSWFCKKKKASQRIRCIKDSVFSISRITAPLRVERSINLFYSSSRSFYFSFHHASRALSRMSYQVKDFSYSTKNIPLASKSKYLQILIEKTESLIHRMRWKTFFFLYHTVKITTNRNTEKPLYNRRF